jgi:tRNA (guanine-N7-)-methyltransferase
LEDKCKAIFPPLNHSYICAMARRKTQQKAAFDAAPNCINADTSIQGHWSQHFGNNQALVLEIGCGRGDHTVALAKRNPGLNFIGLDLKAVRMIAGSLLAQQHGLQNVAFLRTNAEQLDSFFLPAEVAVIWITFPDPYPRKKQTGRRLTHEHFLAIYSRILAPGGEIRFKTDNLSLFDYTLAHFAELEVKKVFHFEQIEISRDVHADPAMADLAAVTTDFERRFLKLGKPIHYLRFKLSPGENIASIPCTEHVGLDLDEKAPRQGDNRVVEI